MSTPQLDDPARRTALTEAEDKALTLFDAIEAAGIIAPGRSETEVDADINALAQSELGIARHWHTCNVRVGANTATTFHDSPPVRVIAPDDTVYVDRRQGLPAHQPAEPYAPDRCRPVWPPAPLDPRNPPSGTGAPMGRLL